ncbi:MAG: hypothetical protein ACJ705_05455 [Nitrososphaeraceae archaeon]
MFPDGHLVVPGVGSDNAKNNNHEQSIGKTSATLEPKYRGSKIKQPHRGYSQMNLISTCRIKTKIARPPIFC